VLARANRLVRADDYRRLVRRGRRYSSAHLLVYVSHSDDSRAPRFGFIVAKSVGGAVQRNTVRRRLKAYCAEIVETVEVGTEMVVRALPGAAQLTWDSLRSEISDSVNRGETAR